MQMPPKTNAERALRLVAIHTGYRVLRRVTHEFI